MEKTNKISIDLYVEKRKLAIIISISLVIYGMFNIIFVELSEIRDLLVNIIYMMSSTMALLISRVVLKTYHSSYKIKMNIFYEVIAINSICRLVPVTYIYDFFYLILYNRNSIYTNWIFSLMFLCLRLYFYQQKEKSNYLIYLVICGFVLTDIIGMITDNVLFYAIINLIAIVICLKIIGMLKNIKLTQNNDISIVYMSVYGILISILLNISYMYIGKWRIIVANLIDANVFIMYTISIILVIDKLLSTPYKVLFSDLYEENIQMNKLNTEVARKNRSLELSQVEIRKKENLYKEFFAKVPVPLAIILKSGRILYANSKFQDLLGETNIKSIVNKKLFSIIKPGENIDIENIITNKINIINGVLKKGDSEKIIDMKFIDVSDSKDEVLITFTDLTYKIKMEKFNMEIKNNRLQEKIKSDFLSNISHDLKTPINVIYSAIQLNEVFIKNKDKEALKKYNLVCKSNCLTLIRLTNNLIDSSKINSDYLSPSFYRKNIVQTLEETVMSLVDYAKTKEINLVFDTNSEEVYLDFDEEFMQRIVINLVSNALKFTKTGGYIEVRVIGLENTVKICFSDNGIGMEEDFIKEAFDRYSMGASRDKERGYGIGLFVVKKLVEAQNGSIKINSKINEGTRIELKFNKENEYGNRKKWKI